MDWLRVVGTRPEAGRWQQEKLESPQGDPCAVSIRLSNSNEVRWQGGAREGHIAQPPAPGRPHTQVSTLSPCCVVPSPGS